MKCPRCEQRFEAPALGGHRQMPCPTCGIPLQWDEPGGGAVSAGAVRFGLTECKCPERKQNVRAPIFDYLQ